MKEINVDSHNVPATARSRNYQTALATTASSGGGATTPSVITPTGGAADTAKVAQNLAEDSTDWTKILRKDIDDTTLHTIDFRNGLYVASELIKSIVNSLSQEEGTDDALYTAKKIDEIIADLSDDYLSKKKDDRTEHSIEIGKNFKVGGDTQFGTNYVEGVTGMVGKIDKDQDDQDWIDSQDG